MADGIELTSKRDDVIGLGIALELEMLIRWVNTLPEYRRQYILCDEEWWRSITEDEWNEAARALSPASRRRLEGVSKAAETALENLPPEPVPSQYETKWRGYMPVYRPRPPDRGPGAFRSGGEVQRYGRRKSPKNPVRIYRISEGAGDWRDLGNSDSTIRDFLESVSGERSLEELTAPFRRGRQSAAERQRYTELARLVAAAHARGAVLEAIGRVIGRPKQLVSELAKHGAQLPPLRIELTTPGTVFDPVLRECEECNARTEDVVMRERVNPKTLALDKRRLCARCGAPGRWHDPRLGAQFLPVLNRTFR